MTDLDITSLSLEGEETEVIVPAVDSSPTKSETESNKKTPTIEWGNAMRASIALTDFEKKDDTDKFERRPLSLGELVQLVCEELNNGKRNYDLIRQYMECYEAEWCEWKRYEFIDKEKRYTRNLIATDNETFTLMLLCWNPNRESPVHDHSNSECFMRLIAGEAREVRYEFLEKGKECSDDKKLKVIADTTMKPGDVAYINDKMGMHKVENPSKTTPAVTLHLYLPPYHKCRCFIGETAKSCETTVTFHSENGVVTKFECGATA